MSPELAALIEKARDHVMTPEEIFEQKVSWCYGMQSSKGPQLTKEQIRAHIMRLEGREPGELPHE